MISTVLAIASFVGTAILYLYPPNAPAQAGQEIGSSTHGELSPEVQEMIDTMINRDSNGTVLSWCTADGYDVERCKQHLRGRMMRFSCPLTYDYEDLRAAWIASYDDPARHDMHPDDAFYAFLEDEDFCDPKQPASPERGLMIQTEPSERDG